MYLTLISLKILLNSAIAGYFGWIILRHHTMRQRGWYLILIGFIILSLSDIFFFIQQLPNLGLPFYHQIGMTGFSVIGHLLVFVGLLTWLPSILSLRQQPSQLTETQLLPQNRYGQNLIRLANVLIDNNTQKSSKQNLQCLINSPESNRKDLSKKLYPFQTNNKLSLFNKLRLWIITAFKNKQSITDHSLEIPEQLLQEQIKSILELQEAYDNFKFHFDNIPLALIEWDAEGRVKYWSPQAEQMFGWTLNEMVGKHYSQWQFIYEEDEPEIIALTNKVLTKTTQTQQYGLYRNYTKEGIIITCEWYISIRFRENQLLSVLTCAKNVTYREQVRKILQKSEIRWRTIFDYAPIGILILNTKGLVVKSNLECKRMFGYLPQQQLMGESLLEWTHPDDIEETINQFRQARRGKAPVYFLENRYLHQSSSSIIMANTHFSLIRDEQQKPRFVVAMIQDITQSKHTQAALQEAHENLAFHLNNIPLAVIEWDAQFRVQHWGHQAEQIFGWSANEIINTRIFDGPFVNENDKHQFAEMASQLANGQRPHNMTLNRHYTKRGMLLYCEWHNSVRLVKDKPVSFLSFVQDVTHREQIRQALHESERLHRLLSENAHDLIGLHNVDGTYIYLSNAVKQLLGYQPEELIGKSHYSLCHPENQKLVAAIYEPSKFSHSKNQVEYRIRRKDGQYIWFETYTNPIKDNNNQTIKLVTSSRDITERKRQEAALRDSKEQLQQRHFEINKLYEFSREIGYTLSLSEVINVLYEYLYQLLPNLSCCSLILADKKSYELRIVSRQPLSKKLIDFIHDEIMAILTELDIPRNDSSEIPISLLNPADSSSQVIQSLETKKKMLLIDSASKDQLTTKMGVLWLGAETSEAFTENSLRLCYTLTNHLLGALKRIRAQIAQEQQHLENLVQYLPTGVILLDAEQHIVLANPVALDSLSIIIGNNANLVLTEPIASVLAPLFDGQIPILLAKPLPTGHYVFELTACPLETGPYMGNYIVIIQDVTERKQMEVQLEAEKASLARRVEERTAELSQANVRLAKANLLKDEFLANMSHELRTPLNTILAASEILVEQIYGILNEKQLKSLQILHNSGKHLLSLINDILDLSKIEAGKVELEYNLFHIPDICQASLIFIKELAHKKQLQVTSKIDGEVNTLYADVRRVKQILINLLNNAVKFTPEGGSIMLEVTSIAEKKAVSFSVIDTGIGIAQEDMPRLFKSFEQIDSGLARQYEGTGLGLALVHKLVDLHGGSITLKSEVGKGSSFTVTLPNWRHDGVKTATDIELLNQPSASAPNYRITSSKLILLAEDNQANVEIMVDYLRHIGYRVNIAGTGIEVLERLTEERHDLILMDIQMPRMDGFETTRCIRTKAEYKNLPIIALTALTMSGDKERCLEAGANTYLSKPVNLQELMRVLDYEFSF